eukprot:TRINITY_DN4013_c0_g4_i1.p1 TRINITY_DN4013_c0_g4~~TRINITY_DN4013_c0_g4_i1.p1  ORF type:complete len:837 (+),score=267.27 TRINITY_DN4013_c0_g4_i1:106-2616(+)
MAVFAGARHYKDNDVHHRLGAYDWDHEEERHDSDDDHGLGRSVHFGREIEAGGGEIADALSACSEEPDLSDKPLKMRIHFLLTDPGSSRLAMWISMWFFLLIILSTLAFILETLPVLSPDPEYGNPNRETFWFALETFFVAFFTLEYVAACSTAETWRYCFHTFQLIDLLAIIPYYIELILKFSGGESVGSNLRFVRIVRLARVFRVLKMGKQYGGTQVLNDVFHKSLPALIPPFFMLFLGIVFFSSLMYICEQGEYDPKTRKFYVDDVHGKRAESTMVSIPECLWWAIVTTTTVGYGDSTPHTAFGKVVNSMTMVFGIMFSAMPIATIGSAFTEKWDEMRIRMNAAKDFRKNEQTNKTCNWGPNQLSFFNIKFTQRACTTIADFLGDSEEAQDAMRALDTGEKPANYVSRRLSHELMTNRDRIEQGVIPQSQWNLAYKLYHVMRAESSKSEDNIENYTLDFVTELYHVLGFGQLDEATDVMLGFRTRAGLAILFGNGTREKEIKSDSDLGIFGIHKVTNRAVYFVGNQAKITASHENNGKIAGELLALAQNAYANFPNATEPKTVFLVTYSGYHLKFYAAEFPLDYLDAISMGKRPPCEVKIRHFPPRLSMHYSHATIQGSFDFLTPSHREEAVETLIRMKRMLATACSSGMRRRGSMYQEAEAEATPTKGKGGLISALKSSFSGFRFRRTESGNSSKHAAFAEDPVQPAAPSTSPTTQPANGGGSPAFGKITGRRSHSAHTPKSPVGAQSPAFKPVQHRSLSNVSGRHGSMRMVPRDSTIPRQSKRSLRSSNASFGTPSGASSTTHPQSHLVRVEDARKGSRSSNHSQGHPAPH